MLIITGIWFYHRHQEQQRKKKELEEKLARERESTRQRLFDFYKSKLDSIRKAVNNFSKNLDFKNGYFTNFQLNLWKKQHSNLFKEIYHQPFKNIHLETKEVTAIQKFRDYFENAKTYRAKFNKKFVEEELKHYSLFFDNIEGRKLDKQQRTAIVTDEDSNLVMAGAGSGKTTTIVGKVNYIITRYKTKPDEILLISFTNKSASTLAGRISIKRVEAKTFHKFGKDVIAEVEERQPSIFDEKQFESLLTRYFKKLIGNENYLQKVTKYFTEFLKPPKSQFEFKNHGDYIQYMKDQNFKTYKLREVPVSGRTTYKREVVKSIEECKIANFLLFKGINYEYELPYEFDTATRAHRQYKPDFTVTQSGKKIYIEHSAVSRSGDIPPFFEKDGETYEQAKRRYWNKINWAREMHRSNGTILIETFSYEMQEDILFENLTEKLQEAGITLRPKSAGEIWQIINQAVEDVIKMFITLFKTFITLMKSNNYTITDVLRKNEQISEEFFKKRNVLLIKIIKPIFERYENSLAERKEIDFSDMINKASEYIKERKYNRQFSYVVIDEFQDISIGRYRLVKDIKQNNPACKLFCVGDDWQSIYRFSGSDNALFKEFEKYFGFTVKSKIETTYRFHNPLIKLSSDFIQKNPNQTRKELRGTGLQKSTNYHIKYSVSENQDDTSALKQIFDELINLKHDIEQKKIYILGRYTFDKDRIKNEERIFQINKISETISYKVMSEEGEIKQINAQFMTIHKAKGLEADIVIILNCNSGRYGFPSEISDDPVLNLLLSEVDQFENGEERRLFYVAMTRAKEDVFFVADSSDKSKFIRELEVESGNTSIKKCPRCKTGDLVKRSGTKNGREWAFYGCSNFSYGCDYQKWIN